MKILILTGKFGMGHWSASQSLCQQLTRAFPRAEVRVVDLFAYAMPGASEALYPGLPSAGHLRIRPVQHLLPAH